MEIIDTWHEAYSRLAKILDSYYVKNETAQIIYSKLLDTEYFRFNESKLARREGILLEKGLDPVQLFATFNFSGVKPESRRENINLLFKAFEAGCEISSTVIFEGIPTPIIAKVISYRGLTYQNEIWDFFHDVQKHGIDSITQNNFDKIGNWHGLNIASVTMFLYWINSEVFIPLDQNTVEFLKEFGLLVSRPKDASVYFDICLRAKIQSNLVEQTYSNVIREMVKDSYSFTHKQRIDSILSGSTSNWITTEVHQNKSEEELENEAKLKKRERFKGFKIVAIRPLSNVNVVYNSRVGQPHQKNLKQDEIYTLYQSYEFVDAKDEIIRYHKENDIDIYDYFDSVVSKDINVSISAIVGKNGSGKSTLIELLYLVINKIAFFKKIKTTEKLKNEEVYADIYVKSDKLYKISAGSTVKIFEYYNFTPDEYRVRTQIEFRRYEIEKFCYSVVINYALYGLNSRIIGDWINPLFFKNDGYQVPIALNPMRIEGNINVNIEEYLAKSRLLSNLLEPERIDFENKIIEDLVPGETPKVLRVLPDLEKINNKRRNYNKKYKDVYSTGDDKTGTTDNKIRLVVEALKIEVMPGHDPFVEIAYQYIYFKLVSITEYSKFKNFKKLPTWIESDPEKLNIFLNEVNKENSHITFKLRQAINFIKYGLYRRVDYNIIELSRAIRDVKEKERLKNTLSKESVPEIRTIELIPPPFFIIDIVFEHGGKFEDLSSGQKQQVLSINTIAYHLYNIDSIANDNSGYQYNCVNIVLDEIELYFHPEMQRTYITNLRSRIMALHLNSINNINIIFVTHSPFILSDIPKANILRLEFNEEQKRSLPTHPNKNTFGANIHELLTESFFLSSSIGEFSKTKINEIIKFYTEVRGMSKDELPKMAKEFREKEEYFSKIADNIGEEFLSAIIKNHLEYIKERMIVK